LKESQDIIQIASDFVNSTASHVFLTGKAGTGKTTFLRSLGERTHKNFVVVAPTGIAALNAGGVTIHSQFLLPIGSFVPETQDSGKYDVNSQFFTRQTLIRKNPLNSDRRQVLRSIDLLIIDEVSMLRADVLDAIDFRMKSVRGNFQESFGGIQVLFIGDLFQLPPIVKDHDWAVLKHHYRSMHFFEAKALKQSPLVYVELTKIFRQEDDSFIRILNNLRNNQTLKEDLDELNEHFLEGDSVPDGVITITTHNYKADQINQSELEALETETFEYHATIEGDFPEKLYPIADLLQLKVGAQVMFVKNDSSGAGAYVNGQLATVFELNEDQILVHMADTNLEFSVRKERWENTKYAINPDTKELEEDVVGSFTHFPLKLAWAVTVHKSQGLTFDKAIIDVGQAFAPGQVYVALSRLRSLDGLILRTRINTHSLSSDSDVVNFSKRGEDQEDLQQILEYSQQNYLKKLFVETFDYSQIEKHIGQLETGKNSMQFEDAAMQEAMHKISVRFKAERENTGKFKNQLLKLLHHSDVNNLESRLEKGSEYYTKFIQENLAELLIHLSEVEQFSRTKKYRNLLSELDQLMFKSLVMLAKCATLSKSIINRESIDIRLDFEKPVSAFREQLQREARKKADLHPKSSKNKSGRKRKGGKLMKGATYEETYKLIEEGLTPKEIAEKRELTQSTIHSHISKGIKEGKVHIGKVLKSETIDELIPLIEASKGGLSEVHGKLKGKYSYDILRLVSSHLSYEATI